MAFQTPITIKNVLEKIQKRECILPAIQREFVWRANQITSLFDSLMRGYPIGSFLFWRIQRENVGEYTWYGFLREYHQSKSRHCPELDVPTETVTAILDGQQRLTSLNIGLRGSHAEKEPRKRWSNPDAFPVKYLYLNLLATLDQESNEQGMLYEFEFLTPARALEDRNAKHHWFKVSDVYEFGDAFQVMTTLQTQKLATSEVALKILHRLYLVVHEALVIPYFEERDQSLDKVLNIFTRVNSGGTPLSYSDLLLSIATAKWTGRDARETIHELVDDLNGIKAGFQLSKDLVLKAGLMLADLPSVAFRVTNFKAENLKVLDTKWDGIERALRLAVALLADFGFSAQNLSADSVIIPVAYYIHHRDLDDKYLTAVTHRGDRELVHKWVCCSLVKSGVWGSGLDTVLLTIREALYKHGSSSFPVSAIETAMALRGKGLSFSEEEVQHLADSAYGDRRTFALLSLLYPHVDLRNTFHIDHIFPRSLFTLVRLRKAGVPENSLCEYTEHFNLLPNLQLLDGAVNISKQAQLPAAWLKSTFPVPASSRAYSDLHDLGDVPEAIADFGDFYRARRVAMLAKLRLLLGVAVPPVSAVSPVGK